MSPKKFRLGKRLAAWSVWWVRCAIYSGTVPWPNTTSLSVRVEFILLAGKGFANIDCNVLVVKLGFDIHLGTKSFHPRVSELKGLLRPSPRSEVSCTIFFIVGGGFGFKAVGKENRLEMEKLSLCCKPSSIILFDTPQLPHVTNLHVHINVCIVKISMFGEFLVERKSCKSTSPNTHLGSTLKTLRCFAGRKHGGGHQVNEAQISEKIMLI